MKRIIRNGVLALAAAVAMAGPPRPAEAGLLLGTAIAAIVFLYGCEAR